MAGKIGVYPGTFDPITNGHLDIIRRAALHVVDRLIIAVALNDGKGPLFSANDRVAMVKAEINTLDKAILGRIEVRPFSSLLIHFVHECEARVIIRGLRAVSDFEYEFQMTGMNARMDTDVETVFLMASDRNQFISSRFVKEIARLGGDVSHFVSPRVVKALAANFPSP